MDECTVTNYDVTLRLLYKCNPKTTTLKITYFLTPPSVRRWECLNVVCTWERSSSRKMFEVEIPGWRAVQAYVGNLSFLVLVSLVWICCAIVSCVVGWCSNVVDATVAKETSSVEAGAYVGAKHDAVMRDVSRRRVSAAKVEKTSQLDCDSRSRASPGNKFYAVRKGRRP